MLSLLLAGGAIAYNIWQQLQSFSQRQREYSKAKQRYLREQEFYQKTLKGFPEQQRQYDVAFKQYLKNYKSWEKVKVLHRDRLRQVLAQAIRHDGTGSKVRRGTAEVDFKRYLSQYFSDKIHTGYFIKIPNSFCQYTPDFVYIDSSFNLYIDIEIDEPYVYDTKEPIHYVGSDDKRNESFCHRLWIVIRFTEEQVICWPKNCCKSIAKEISQIIGDSSILSPFANISDLKPMTQWTEDQAREMANSGYRDTYLA
ncbi:MAG: hypothetical protein NVS2B14_11910 [Chamaesiphon sp.]